LVLFVLIKLFLTIHRGERRCRRESYYYSLKEVGELITGSHAIIIPKYLNQVLLKS